MIMNDCDVDELKQVAIQRFLSIPNENFEECGDNPLSSKTVSTVSCDVWRWWLNYYAPESFNCLEPESINCLELNGVIVATHVPGRHSEEPLWVAKTREVDKALRQKRECKKLMEALGMNKKPTPEEPTWPRRKWWQFRK